MKRILLSIATVVMIGATASAVPAKRLVKTVTQPDGTTVTVTQMGDERYHAYVTSDGLAVNFTDKGYAVYQSVGGQTDVYVHEVGQRTADEQSFIQAQESSLTFKANRLASPHYQAMATNNVQSDAQIKRAAGRISIEQQSSTVPHKGSNKIPVLLVQYSDVKFKDSDPKSTFEQFFAGESGVSGYQYFHDMSQGKYEPQFEVYGPYTLSNKRAYYGGSDSNGSDEKPGEMVKDACTLADSDVDFSRFDNDGDGKCDVVVILYAGVGQASSGVAAAVWPCQWALSEENLSKTCDGVKIDTYGVFNELNGTSTSKIDGIGTFCHEFSHCLGLPDFYETTYNNGYYGMDEWSLMDYGCYNNDGYTPVGYTAYEKAFMGWMTLTEGVANTYYTLPYQNNISNRNDMAVVLVNSSNSNEYFIFESRQQQGWDEYMSDAGMLINHVTYSSSYWSDNTVNNYSTQRMTIVPADNVLSQATNSADLWPKSYATEFTNTSTPAAKTNYGSYLSCPVTEITRNATTGEVSFWVDKAAVPTLATPTPNEASDVKSNGFTASWSPVSSDDTDVTYTLQVWPKVDTTLSIWNDYVNSKSNSEWTTSGYTLETSGSYIRLGSGKQTGSITSSLTMSPVDGKITIAARAVRYGNDSGCKVVLSAVNGTTVAATSSLDCPTSVGYVYTVLTGLDDTKTYKVRVANGSTSSKRVLLSKVLAFAGEVTDLTEDNFEAALSDAENNSSSAPALAPVVTTSGSKITISGITDTSYTITDLTEPVYYYNVKAVPTDNSVANESAWSNQIEVQLGTSGVDNINIEQPAAEWTAANGQIITSANARLYSISGAEVAKIAEGRFAPASGVYILVVPGCEPVKVVL